jgi:photosystem II stability/assembly factor-like uncharacterized protein
MNNPQKLFCVLAVVVSQWPLAAAAQSPVGEPPPAHPYVWRAVAMGGGGFVDGIVFHPAEKNLMYARTDVGGAYRWDDKKQEWVALNDWLSPAEGNFTGIESIGLDPSDPNRLYLAAGTYANGAAAILRSDDQGRTFQYSEAPFRMGGNADGRHNGERLAVDPNEGTILFFGSRSAGLWKSGDRGVTWNAVTSFPNTSAVQPRPVINAASTNSVSTNAPARGRRGGGFGGGNQPIGIVSVVFDAASGRRGAPTPVIYAAAAVTGTNLFRSDDAGATWQAVANQPVGLRPNHLIQSPDGFFYLTYGNLPGPNNVTDGAAWKYNPKDGSWKNISPEKPAEGQRLGWGYGAVSVDLKHPNTVVITTIDRWQLKDEVFRSTDGGATWKGILVANNGRLDYSMAPYVAQGHTPHWTGSVAINPGNPDQILFGTGYGIWASTNASAVDDGKPVTWIFLDKGLEETVPLALVSPATGAHLISGVGDIDGFRHDDVDVSPPQGTFAGPRFSSTRDLAYASGKPEVIVRIGNGGRGGAHAAISEDGGTTWKALGRDPQGGNGGTGKLALSADGSVIVWAVQRGSAFATFDRGTTWTNCQGFSGGSIVADPVNPSCFYAFDAQNGKLLVSTNQAASFEATVALLPAAQGNAGRGGGGGVLAATTGMKGDIWVGSRNGGLYHSTDGGESFTKLDNVSGADALGFGKAAPGKTLPAIFLLGNINQLHARYRSDDAGQTWVRIDDDQHQYANADVPMIIGDPRIYGRVYFTTGGRGVIYGDINTGLNLGKK